MQAGLPDGRKDASEEAQGEIAPRSEQDLANMVMILRLKLDQHPELKGKLLATGTEEIIEDCTKRPSGKFWGAVLKDGQWIGENTLGKLWMQIRATLAS